MNLAARLIVMLCVFAGLGGTMVHASLHSHKEHCTSHCGSDHEDTRGHDHDDDSPHHHACCQIPSADRVTDSVFLPTTFRCVLVEIAADHSQAPEDPVFALDKPPLI